MSTKNSMLLEVDRTILESNLLLKENVLSVAPPDELDRLFPAPQESLFDVPSKLVQLTPGLCVKTHSTKERGGKVFLNICTTPAVPAPEDLSDDALVQILSSDDPSTFRVPMSLGEGHVENDKAGKPCSVHDVAIHPQALQKMRGSELFRQFLLTAAMEGLEDKFGLALDKTEAIVLTKRKSMGTPRQHRIRQDRAKPPGPLIAELSPHQVEELKPPRRVPKYLIRREPARGDLEYMVAEITLTDVVSSRDLSVDVGEDRIVLQGHKSGYCLDVFLPIDVNREEAAAQFNRDTRVLTLTLPVKRNTGQ